MSLFYDLYQNSQITAARASADAAKSEAERQRMQIAELQRRADAVAIGFQALWEIVREQGGISDETIVAKIQEIDLRDGQADGKITRPMVTCPSCGRQSNAARKNCLYCGTELPVTQVFGAV